MQPNTPTDSPRRPFRWPPRIDNLEHIGSILDDLLNDLELAVEEAIDERGGFVGHVRPTQHRFIMRLDRLAHGRDLDSLADQS